ncbi:MAG: HD domain-containing protein [Bacteroidales bacterium]|nr:HD domain-containing protein [Bacteroidales bacterium]
MDIESLQRENEQLCDEIAHLKRLLDDANSQIAAIKQSEMHEEPSSHDMENRRFKMVTVMYAKISGFEKLQSVENAQSLVDGLDSIMRHVDEIVSKYNIKKVKSLGDSYMCAGGIPEKNRTNPIEMILAAMEIVRYLHADKGIWDITMGIHTGPVAAIISGKKKKHYEVTGDAANIAYRIESFTKPGQIVISEMTYGFLRDVFSCEVVGALPVKYVGGVRLYRVTGFKPKYAVDAELQLPNHDFFIRLAQVRFPDLEEYILNRLEKELPPYLHYHNVKHTMDVLIGVEVIATAENVTDEEDMLLLRTAALFHDMGQIVQSKGHENISCDYAREILPRYCYSQEQIDKICTLIMATQLPPNPTTLLECIMCDADLDYLGRSDFIPVSDTLYDELHVQNIVNDKNTWNKQQIKFISNHTYFTNFAKNNREVNKQKQIKRLQSLIKE